MDISYLLFLQRLREAVGGILDGFMLEITSMAESVPTFLLLAGIYWCIDKRTGQLMGWNTALACTWSQFLKAACRIDRPWIRDSRVHPVEAAVAAAGGYSFPSGHTARAVASWGAAASRAWTQGRKGGNPARQCLGAVLWGIVFLIMFSRNYLGVHTPQDVAVSFLTGLLLIQAADRVLDWTENGQGRDLFVWIGGCLFCFVPMLRVGCLTNAGAGMGLLTGWFLEHRFVKFETDGTAGQKWLRFAAGAVPAVFLLKTVSPVLGLFMAGKYAGFFSMFLFGVYLMAGYPWFFSRIAACKSVRDRRQGVAAGIVLGIIGIGVLFAASVTGVRMRQIQSAASGQAPSEADQAQEIGTDGGEKIQVIAHRGYSSAYPENTQAAFAGALAAGADYIETDVQMTKDGQAVLFHDDTLERVMGVQGRIAEYTYEELSGMDAGTWFSDDYAGERIVTLQQMLELVRDSDVKIYLELKDIGNLEGFEETVLAATDAADMTKRCVFASFCYEYLKHLKELDADVQVLYNTLSADAGLTEEFPAEYYGIAVDAVTAEAVLEAHAASRRVFVWTADTPGQMKRLQEMGVDGIVTNDPGLAGSLGLEAEAG